MENGELEFEVNFENDVEYRISIEDELEDVAERRIINVD
jgi:hypothetical protein